MPIRTTRTHTHLFNQDLIDKISGDILRLRWEFDERKPYIERHLQEIAEARLEAFKTFCDMLQYEV